MAKTSARPIKRKTVNAQDFKDFCEISRNVEICSKDQNEVEVVVKVIKIQVKQFPRE